ncbi:MAG: choice-of-anchor B family protein [Bacteroidia bacterium]
MKLVYAGLRTKSFVGVLFALIAITSSAYSQGSQNVVLRSNWDNNALPTVAGYQYNDVWGYAAAGREYAFIGSTVGVHVIDITVPTAPVHLFQLNSACASSRWRDFATYQNYLYVIADNCAGAGLQIYNLNTLPGAAPTLVYNSTAHFTSAHTIFINPNSGRIYIGGANTQMNGVIILDIQGHPTTPTMAATFTLGAYTHDMYVHNDTLYAFFGSSGVGSFDLVNLSFPYAMGYIAGYPESGYAHSGWGIKNNRKLVWLDETSDKGVHVADIEDPWNITWQNNFRSALLAPTHVNSMPHNAVAVGDILYVSYYQDGLQVWNMANPAAPVRLGYYDTNTNGTYTGMFGAWGIHPPLPSGNILVSDTENGLFVLQLNAVFPVQFSSFEVDALQNRVNLRWTTQSENNCQSFEIERSADGLAFSKIGEVAGAGTSSLQHDYSSFDGSPLQGKSFYRIKQVDFDGNSQYSEIREVEYAPATFSMRSYPNPAASGSGIRLAIDAQDAAVAELEVFDMVGRLMHRESVDIVPGTHSIYWPSTDWSNGTYMAVLAYAGKQVQEKIVISK